MKIANRLATQSPLRMTPIAAALLSLSLASPCVLSAPEGGVVRAGAAHIDQTGARTQVLQSSDRAVIDWRAFGVAANEQVAFQQPSRQSATLNRVTGEQLSVILGRIDANGQVLLVNPHGVLIGGGAQINVGGLIASTANISNENFMRGRLVFDQPGSPGARIVNQGTITAADSGLVALVAPSVRNDGLIQARLGKVMLGAGDTFTLDLQGDGLINLAIAPARTEQLRATDGGPLISQAGRIEAAGGEVVLITAPQAEAVLNEVINMSGSIRADTVAQQGGRIVLLGRGGGVNVSGNLSAEGVAPGEAGGDIEVLGDRVQLATGARLDASGQAGGGAIRVGGAWQGQGETYQARQTQVEAGAELSADARESGKGGEVVVWASGGTAFGGTISARGGMTGGNGGRVEVSGKQNLDFRGDVRADAPFGAAGLLLLDPAYLNIGAAEAGLIGRVLRTGTSTQLAADVDINVNAPIDGRGRMSGGGLTLRAGNDINVNDFILTNNGAINLLAAGGTVRIGNGIALFAGNAPIAVRVGANVTTGQMITTGPISVASDYGSVLIGAPISGSGTVSIHSARSIRVNQPIYDLLVGAGVEIGAGDDVDIGRDIVTNNAPISISATSGTIRQAAGTQLRAGAGSIWVQASGDLVTGSYVTEGALSAASTGGTLYIRAPIPDTTGAVTFVGNTVVVSEPIHSRQDINITAKTGDMSFFTPPQADPTNVSAAGNITLRATGDIVMGVTRLHTPGTLNITSTGGEISGGLVGHFGGELMQQIVLEGASGIANFNALDALNIEAHSSEGSVELIFVSPLTLHVVATNQNITLWASEAFYLAYTDSNGDPTIPGPGDANPNHTWQAAGEKQLIGVSDEGGIVGPGPITVVAAGPINLDGLARVPDVPAFREVAVSLPAEAAFLAAAVGSDALTTAGTASGPISGSDTPQGEAETEDSAQGTTIPHGDVLATFDGGRGLAQFADLGRSGTFGGVADLYFALGFGLQGAHHRGSPNEQ